MYKFRLYDSNFEGSASSSLYHSPRRLEWLRHGKDTEVVFYTDYHLETAKTASGDTYKIAWILEPRAINPAPYNHVLAHQDDFDLILTHHADMLGHGDVFAYYPNGMSWIADHDWKKHQKTADVSIIASGKTTTDGHRLRHRIVQRTAGRVDVFGMDYQPVDHKVEALGRYRFSVTIENSYAPWYFTEKLLDCFATYTVPIYWGCPGIENFFDTDGMILVSSEEEILYAVDHVVRDGETIYKSMMPAMTRNHKAAAKYKVAEDWIVDNVLIPQRIVPTRAIP